MGLSDAQRRAFTEVRRQRLGYPPRRRVQKLDREVWSMAFDASAELDVSPWDALLVVVRRRAARVARVDAVVAAAWEAHRRRCEQLLGDPMVPDHEVPDPAVPGAEVRTWLAESRAEEALLAHAAKLAVSAGVADALVRRWDLEGRVVTAALVAGLDALQLEPEARLRALAAAHEALTTAETRDGDHDNVIELRAVEDSFEPPTDDNDNPEEAS